MGGIFGVASKSDCVMDLFFGIDYHSHLGTRRGCGSLSEIQPIPRLPSISATSLSNLVRNGEFSILWITRLNPLLLL